MAGKIDHELVTGHARRVQAAAKYQMNLEHESGVPE